MVKVSSPKSSNSAILSQFISLSTILMASPPTAPLLLGPQKGLPDTVLSFGLEVHHCKQISKM